MNGPSDSYFKHVLLHLVHHSVSVWGLIIPMADIQMLQERESILFAGIVSAGNLFKLCFTMKFSLWFQQSCCFMSTQRQSIFYHSSDLNSPMKICTGSRSYWELKHLHFVVWSSPECLCHLHDKPVVKSKKVHLLELYLSIILYLFIYLFFYILCYSVLSH